MQFFNIATIAQIRKNSTGLKVRSSSILGMSGKTIHSL